MSGHLPALDLSGPSRAQGGPQPDTSLQLLPGLRSAARWPAPEPQAPGMASDAVGTSRAHLVLLAPGAGARLVRLPLGAEPFQVPSAPLLAGPSCGTCRGARERNSQQLSKLGVSRPHQGKQSIRRDSSPGLEGLDSANRVQEHRGRCTLRSAWRLPSAKTLPPLSTPRPH